jgi:archaellin
VGAPDGAEVSIAHLIVFVAALLLAAATAGLLLGVGRDVADTGQGAGAAAIARTNTALQVEAIVGRIQGSGPELDALNLTVRLAPAADRADLGALVLQLVNKTAQRTLVHGATAGAGVFTVAAVRDADGSLAQGLLDAEDLATLDADLSAAANDLLLPTREPVTITLVPDPGLPLRIELVTPPTYGSQTIVTLR